MARQRLDAAGPVADTWMRGIDMKTVPLHGAKAAGRVALVDDADYELVMQFRWFITERKRNGRTHGPYAQTKAWLDGQYRAVKMHRLITSWPMVDHRDHDGLNNQRYNLRPTTSRRNQHNSRGRMSSTSRFKGVCWNSDRGQWMVQINIGGQNRYLGLFADEEEAARFYDTEARRTYGEHAYLNFPEGPSRSPAGDGPPMAPNRDGWVPSVKHLRPACKKCGGPLRIVSKTGICTRNPECAAESKRMRVKAEAA